MLATEIVIVIFALILVVVFALICNPPTQLISKFERKRDTPKEG